jgi:hypothetical protein
VSARAELEAAQRAALRTVMLISAAIIAISLVEGPR